MRFLTRIEADVIDWEIQVIDCCAVFNPVLHRPILEAPVFESFVQNATLKVSGFDKHHCLLVRQPETEIGKLQNVACHVS